MEVKIGVQDSPREISLDSDETPEAVTAAVKAAIDAGSLLFRNLMVYGVGGVIVPFIGIKLIDMMIAALGLA